MTKVLSLRVPDDLAVWVSEYAVARGVSRSVVIEEALRAMLGSASSVETPRSSPAGRQAKSRSPVITPAAPAGASPQGARGSAALPSGVVTARQLLAARQAALNKAKGV